jgi:hypothetical protein
MAVVTLRSGGRDSTRLHWIASHAADVLLIVLVVLVLYLAIKASL